MIQVVFVIIIYFLVPALLLTWVVRRYKEGTKPGFYEGVAVLSAVLLVALLIYAYSGTISEDNEAELETIVTTLTERYDFPVKSKFKDRPAVDGLLHARNYEIRIYGVVEPKQQERVVEILKKLRRQVASKPIVANFLLEEVWQENPDGSRVPRRDQEQLIRKYRFE